MNAAVGISLFLTKERGAQGRDEANLFTVCIVCMLAGRIVCGFRRHVFLGLGDLRRIVVPRRHGWLAAAG